MHSCGKIEAVVPEFVELGIDAWQGMEINDIPKLKSITGMNLGYHTTPDYQGYQTEALAGTLTEEDLRRRVREVFEKTAEGYCYCPMFLPFGGWSTEVMIDEIMKCGKTIYKDAYITFMMYKKTRSGCITECYDIKHIIYFTLSPCCYII